MRARPTILIVTSQTGGGPVSMAAAWQELLSQQYDTHVVDAFPGIINWYYTRTQRYTQLGQLWNVFMSATSRRSTALGFHRVLSPPSQMRLASLMRRYRPALVLVTHPMLSYPAARAARASAMPPKVVFQLSELEGIHRFYFTEQHADAYLAPTQEVAAEAAGHGIGPERLFVTGRPVRAQFYEDYSAQKEPVLRGLGLDPQAFTVFLQAGAMGAHGIQSAVEAIAALPKSIQVIAAAGSNQKVRHSLAGDNRVRVLPYIDNIAPYMAASDIVAGKAGASSISEAAILGKPILITTHLPGQESGNLRFVVRHNLGWVCLTPADQSDLLRALLERPQLMEEKAAGAMAFKRWNDDANRTRLPIIEGLLGK